MCVPSDSSWCVGSLSILHRGQVKVLSHNSKIQKLLKNQRIFLVLMGYSCGNKT